MVQTTTNKSRAAIINNLDEQCSMSFVSTLKTRGPRQLIQVKPAVYTLAADNCYLLHNNITEPTACAADIIFNSGFSDNFVIKRRFP
jgi:hypothetical protein